MTRAQLDATAQAVLGYVSGYNVATHASIAFAVLMFIRAFHASDWRNQCN